MDGAGIKGVAPSRRVMTGVLSLTGNQRRYPSIRPGQSCIVGFLDPSRRRMEVSRGTVGWDALDPNLRGSLVVAPQPVQG